MDKNLLNSTECRMKKRVNSNMTTQKMILRIKYNNKTYQCNRPQTTKQFHRRENCNLSHMGCERQKAGATAAINRYRSRPSETTSSSSCRSIHINNQKSFNLTRKHLWFIILVAALIPHVVESFERTTSTTSSLGQSTRKTTTTKFSQLLSTDGQMTSNTNNAGSPANDDDTFRPFIPNDLEMVSRNVFTPSGQFRVFQPIDTDLRATVALEQQRSHNENMSKMSEPLFASVSSSSSSHHPSSSSSSSLYRENQTFAKQHMYHHVNPSIDVNLSKDEEDRKQHHHPLLHQHPHPPHANNARQDDIDVERNEISKQDDLTSDLKSLEDLLTEYITNFFEKGQYTPAPGLIVELQNNHSLTEKTRNVRHIAPTDAKVSIDLPRTMSTGRLLFLTGLKKVLWPVFMGLQVLKSLLIAMFIPAIIGSFTKLLGKGITTGSAPLFIRPMEPPQELDFRDNSINFEDDNKFLVTDDGTKDNGPYAYNQPDASQMHNQYAYNQLASAGNPLTFTRLGMNERQHQLMQDSYMSALQSIGSASFKNSGSLSSGSSGLLAPMAANKPMPTANVNTFQQFQKVPDSSLLLSNYDPFYSPLLSRLDSVFAQLKINSDNEVCREKLICLMYANPAKYAPYSNLVSAQLSRELNELRKPTSDNPDILRFFKYMRAAKDGQDGVECEKTFDKCTEFKDFENPAMVSTYHDINKLVQARKLT